MKSKTKTQPKRGKAKAVSYPAHYLAIALGLMILMEGFMMGVATPHDWSAGLSVLDISGSVNEVASDLATTVEPMMDQVVYINNFYQMAATELMPIVDWSDSDFLVFPKSVIKFYDLASVQMAEVLDFSDNLANMPQVAGLSIFK